MQNKKGNIFATKLQKAEKVLKINDLWVKKTPM